MKKRLAYIVATPLTYQAFLKGHFEVLRNEYDVTLIANFCGHPLDATLEEVEILQVGIERKISVFRDLLALVHLVRILRRCRFDIVHSVTPKAGLLASVAGRLAGTHIRIHTFTGQVWATRHGLERWLLKAIDKVTLSCSTHALADSRSQAAFLASEGFDKQICVLGDGAIAGIDSARFRRDETLREITRRALGLSGDDFVFVFLGRLNRDKGVMDLVDGFTQADLGPRYKLLIVGPDEGGLAPIIAQNPLVRSGMVLLTGGTSMPERELNAGDVMCLPSYREGFGSAILEAASIGLPAIASRIYGLSDAVVEGTTGIMHTAGNVEEIASCLKWFAAEPTRARVMGENARARAITAFSQERITNELRLFYQRILRPH